MGKIVKQKQHRGVHRGAGAFHPAEVTQAAAAPMQPFEAADEDAEGQETEAHKGGNMLGLSRGQRKRLAKKVAAERKKTLVGEGIKTNLKLQSGALGDLESIARSLELAGKANSAKEAAKPNPNRSMKMTKKNRKRVMVTEVANLQSVLAHPSFQADPMSTIQCHLQNSIRGANNA